jgi:hypothetical protein
MGNQSPSNTENRSTSSQQELISPSICLEPPTKPVILPLDLARELSERMQIYIKINTGRTIKLDAQRGRTVEEVKDKIFEIEEICQYDQQPCFSGLQHPA